MVLSLASTLCSALYAVSFLNILSVSDTRIWKGGSNDSSVSGKVAVGWSVSIILN